MMTLRTCALLLALCGGVALTGEGAQPATPATKLPPEERRRKFEALKKELEAFRPAQDAADEEMLAYFQQLISLSTRFAKDNPQTTEGFEAAFNAAVQLAGKQHAQTSVLAQTALDVAPNAGVDQRQLATCWVLVAYGKILKSDMTGAKESLEKVKPLDPDLYERARAQFESIEAQKKK